MPRMIQQMGHPDKGDNRGVWSLPSVTRRAAGLVWQRDIKGKRTKSSPVGQDDLRTSIEMNLVEMRDDVPALTSAWSRCAVDAATSGSRAPLSGVSDKVLTMALS